MYKIVSFFGFDDDKRGCFVVVIVIHGLKEKLLSRLLSLVVQAFAKTTRDSNVIFTPPCIPDFFNAKPKTELDIFRAERRYSSVKSRAGKRLSQPVSSSRGQENKGICTHNAESLFF